MRSIKAVLFSQKAVAASQALYTGARAPVGALVAVPRLKAGYGTWLAARYRHLSEKRFSLSRKSQHPPTGKC